MVDVGLNHPGIAACVKLRSTFGTYPGVPVVLDQGIPPNIMGVAMTEFTDFGVPPGEICEVSERQPGAAFCTSR